MKKHFVYIIHSSSHNIFYKGYSSRPLLRLFQHNNNKSTFTAHKGPWVLVFLKEFPDKSSALKFELMLKRQNTRYLRWLVNSEKNDLF